MHDEEQQLQAQQPNRPDAPSQQTLELARRIIARKNTQFILDHQNDTLEQLSAYLQACMEDIGHPPARVEVIGGDYIEYRFDGSWQKALRSFYSGSIAYSVKNPPEFKNRKIVRDLCADLEPQSQEANSACTEEVRA